MIWKTNWTADDNYAINGCDDFNRLLSNYEMLKQLLIDDFAASVNFTPIETKGYRTIPFADILNAIEHNLNELHQLDADWRYKNIVWQPGGNAPIYDDINRWEHNGQVLEKAIILVSFAMKYCGTISCGQQILPQYVYFQDGTSICGTCICGDVQCGTYVLRSEIK